MIEKPKKPRKGQSEFQRWREILDRTVVPKVKRPMKKKIVFRTRTFRGKRKRISLDKEKYKNVLFIIDSDGQTWLNSEKFKVGVNVIRR